MRTERRKIRQKVVTRHRKPDEFNFPRQKFEMKQNLFSLRRSLRMNWWISPPPTTIVNCYTPLLSFGHAGDGIGMPHDDPQNRQHNTVQINSNGCFPLTNIQSQRHSNGLIWCGQAPMNGFDQAFNPWHFRVQNKVFPPNLCPFWVRTVSQVERNNEH